MQKRTRRGWRVWIAVVALAVGLWGCAAGVAAEVSTDTAQGQTPSPSGGADWTQSEEGKALIGRAEQVLAEVEVVRGLSTTAPVKKGLMLKADLEGVLLEKMKEEYSDEEIAQEGMGLKALGLIPEDMNYKDFMVSLLVEQIAGFYDDSTRSLYIMEGQAANTLDQVFSHELYHAVQDQQFGISNIRDEEAKKNSDLMLARTALIEGDAVGVMLDYEMRAQGQSFSDIKGFGMIIRLSMAMVGGNVDVFSKAPLAIRESLLFPYVSGVLFIYEVKRAGGWEAVNQLYRALPTSTEQILHPERYRAGDQPRAVTFEGQGGEVIYDNVMGEQGWRVYLQQHAGEETERVTQALSAAEGWGGDRLKVMEEEGVLSVYSLSVWDTEQDAREFEEALTYAASRRWGAVAAAAAPAAGVVLLRGERKQAWIERRGDQVVYVEGAPGDDAQLAQRARGVWEGAAVSGARP
jgi:hypothetical protein